MNVTTTSDSACVGCGGIGVLPNHDHRWWKVWKPIFVGCDRCEGTGNEPRLPRVFVGQPGGEGPFYCGDLDDGAELMKRMFHVVAGELGDFLAGWADGDRVELAFEIRQMTDAEVAALPEL